MNTLDDVALMALALQVKDRHPSSGLFPTPIRHRARPRTFSEVDRARADKKQNKKNQARKRNKAARKSRRRSR